jgi:RNA polymerase sigma-70 factor (ECF subfamily)
MPDPGSNIPSDAEFIARVATRDRDAFAALYDRFSPKLFGLILHFLKIQDDAEEVLQEVFIQMWDQAGRFDPARSTVEAWLVMIARSRALDRLRRKSNTVPLSFDIAGLELDGSPLSNLERSDEAWRVLQGLKALPPDQSEAIQLAFYGGLTHNQIAQQLGIPVGTVKTRIRLGMIRLRTLLNSGQGDEIR